MQIEIMSIEEERCKIEKKMQIKEKSSKNWKQIPNANWEKKCAKTEENLNVQK